MSLVTRLIVLGVLGTCMACSPSPQEEEDLSAAPVLDLSTHMSDDMPLDQTSEPVDMPADLDTSSPDMEEEDMMSPDLPVQPPPVTATRPVLSPDTVFVDVHTHCGDTSANDPEQCNLSANWSAVHEAGGHAMILSIEHWALSLDAQTLAEIEATTPGFINPLKNNKIYTKTGAQKPSVSAFVSLDCWHDTPFGEGWVEACKEDARYWIEQGAHGFKDHVGKSWQSDSDGPEVADAGIFPGAFTRNAGLCDDLPTNRACVQSEHVLYPVLLPEWREVVRYITEDLKAPIITHSTTFHGAEVNCYDPMSSALRNCAEMSREHLIDLTQWAERELSPEARRRIVIAHMAFSLPGEKFLPRQDDSPDIALAREAYAEGMIAQLRTMLDTGVSIETATTKDFVAMTYRQTPGALGACVIRDLFASYPEQIMLGTDSVLSREGCLAGTYQLWGDLISSDVHVLNPTRGACFGQVATYGLALEKTMIPECPGALPDDALSNFLIDNFLNLYEE